MKIKGVDFVFFNVTDFGRAQKFFEETLGLKVIKCVANTWAEFDTGTLALAIGSYGASPIAEGASSNVSVALAVDDVKAAVETLRGKGVKIKVEPQDYEPCVMAVILDPDGNEIILHHRKDGTVG